MPLRDHERFSQADAADSAGRPAVDAHAREPEREARFAEQVLRLRRGASLLLLHARQAPQNTILSARGIHVTGIDVAGLRAPNRRSATPAPELVAASQHDLPFRDASFDAAVEFGGSTTLSLEQDGEALFLLAEVHRVLRPRGRLLCGGPGPAGTTTAGPRLSADKRRIEEWRREPAGVLHHTLNLMRPDGSWQRLHERMRKRDIGETQTLLERAGFSILNAFSAYDQRATALRPDSETILLCQRD